MTVWYELPIIILLCTCRLQEKLKQKRLEKEADERKQEIQREKQRRTFGKDVVAAKEK